MRLAMWVVDRGNAGIASEPTGTWLHTYGKKGAGTLQFESPEGIAVNTSPASPSFDMCGQGQRGCRAQSKGEYLLRSAKKALNRAAQLAGGGDRHKRQCGSGIMATMSMSSRNRALGRSAVKGP
jgi:hypothetical protein